jgi:methionine aminopeptidase
VVDVSCPNTANGKVFQNPDKLAPLLARLKQARLDVAGKTMPLTEGMALAVEPMVCAGARHVRTLSDDWTIVTVDGQRACHWEHTVAITDGGPLVLTAPPAAGETVGTAA